MTCNTINFIAKPIKTTRNPFKDTGACKDSRVRCSDERDNVCGHRVISFRVSENMLDAMTIGIPCLTCEKRGLQTRDGDLTKLGELVVRALDHDFYQDHALLRVIVAGDIVTIMAPNGKVLN
tara:strand:- start:345 stop:710 length:366 start_codon:yes stop_codon:yes gene_type:complete